MHKLWILSRNYLFLWCFLSTGLHAQNQAVILQYHHVATDTPAVTSLSPETFRLHMEYLELNGFSILRLEEVIAALRSRQTLPDKTAVITFDDGYLSVYEQAFPVLRDYGWPFTVFISAGLVSSNSRLYASWEQLREMGSFGATLANHTTSHPYFLDRDLSQDEKDWLDGIRTEIEQAERMILDETGQSHRLLAYPYGEYDPAIQALVAELGYVGIAQHSGPIGPDSDYTALPRFPFSGIYSSLNSFSTKVNSLAFNVRIVEPETPVTTEQSPQAVIQFDGDYRLDALACFNNDQPMSISEIDAESGQYRLSTDVRNTGRRFRYNCTAPGADGRYYWYSIPWVNPRIPE